MIAGFYLNVRSAFDSLDTKTLVISSYSVIRHVSLVQNLPLVKI